MSGLLCCAVAAGGAGWTGASAPASGDATPPAGSPARTGQPGWHVAGEYGLYVAFADAGLEVRWLTEEERPGRVRAIVDGRVVDERTTDPGYAHEARLRVRAPDVTLEYGAEARDDAGGGAALHQTRIWAEPLPAEVDLAGPDSMFVFGDVHGEFDRVITLLGLAGLIDAELRWTGGDAVVAFLGDLFDRGNDVTRLLWFVYGLEREALAAGGRESRRGGRGACVLVSSRLVDLPAESAVERHEDRPGTRVAARTAMVSAGPCRARMCLTWVAEISMLRHGHVLLRPLARISHQCHSLRRA